MYKLRGDATCTKLEEMQRYLIIYKESFNSKILTNETAFTRHN